MEIRSSMRLLIRTSGFLFIAPSAFLLFSHPVLGDKLLNSEVVCGDWVTDAESLVGDLSELDLTKPYRFQEFPSKEAKRADELLWELWLKTGMPPLVKGDSSFVTHVRKNVTAYRHYISKHRNLSVEQLHRLGLRNCIVSYGSPLWYMTLRYLAERVNFRSSRNIFVSGLQVIKEVPLREGASERYSARFARWLKDNEKEFVWDAGTNKFRPRNGIYIGTEVVADFDFDDLRNFHRRKPLSGDKRPVGEGSKQPDDVQATEETGVEDESPATPPPEVD